jgi:hypothetical protein
MDTEDKLELANQLQGKIACIFGFIDVVKELQNPNHIINSLALPLHAEILTDKKRIPLHAQISGEESFFLLMEKGLIGLEERQKELQCELDLMLT